MKRPILPHILTSLILSATLANARAQSPTLTIEAGSPTAKVSSTHYGLMTEEINHSYDGGLYAELIRNRAFLDDARSPVHWSIAAGDGSAPRIALDQDRP